MTELQEMSTLKLPVCYKSLSWNCTLPSGIISLPMAASILPTPPTSTTFHSGERGQSELPASRTFYSWLSPRFLSGSHLLVLFFAKYHNVVKHFLSFSWLLPPCESHLFLKNFNLPPPPLPSPMRVKTKVMAYERK